MESCSFTTSQTSDRLTVSLSLLRPPPSISQFIFSLDVRFWNSCIEEYGSEGVNKILIGNKSDRNEKRMVTEQQGGVLAQQLGIQFMETSAKTGEGVREAFLTLARYPSVCIQDPYHRHSFHRH